jgi:hypothetical protein
MSVALLGLLAPVACGDDGGGDLDAFCATARRFAVDNPADALGAYDPADPAGAARLLRRAADDLESWADDAPPDLRPDVVRLATTASDLADAFEAGALDAGRAATLEAAAADAETASARVTEATRAQCSVELDPQSATTPTTG